MQYLLLIYGNEAGMKSASETDRNAMFKAYGEYTTGIIKSGHMRAGEALQPSSTATTVRVREGRTLSTDGPFAETKEQLGGYYLIDVPNLDDAVHWAARCPAAMGGSIEVRPLGHSAPSDK